MSMTQRQVKLRVGDRVSVDFGRRRLTGVIVEDRGAIGARGRRLFRVNIPMDPFEPMMLELPEDELESAMPMGAVVPIDKQRITDYLVNGGLVAILRSNLSGGRNQPRVWLCLDNLGNITHTFLPERGIIGGELVPVWAIQDERVLKPKLDSVVALVHSLGLNHQESKKVVSEVGIAP